MNKHQPDQALVTVHHLERRLDSSRPLQTSNCPFEQMARTIQVTGRAGLCLLQCPFKRHITCDGPAVNGPPCAILRQINLVATPRGDKGIDSGKVLPCSGSCSLITMMNGSLLPCRVSYIPLRASLEVA